MRLQELSSVSRVSGKHFVRGYLGSSCCGYDGQQFIPEQVPFDPCCGRLLWHLSAQSSTSAATHSSRGAEIVNTLERENSVAHRAQGLQQFHVEVRQFREPHQPAGRDGGKQSSHLRKTDDFKTDLLK